MMKRFVEVLLSSKMYQSIKLMQSFDSKVFLNGGPTKKLMYYVEIWQKISNFLCGSQPYLFL